jgi:ABC-2 type transport system ATP-binding protein
LDEPTTGVDLGGRRIIKKILSDLHLSGTTIVVSTPYMDEADRCSRVGLIYEGRLIRCASPKEIRSSLDAEMIIFIPDLREGVEDILLTIPGVLEVQTYGDAFHILVDDADKLVKKIRRIMKQNNRSFRELRVTLPRMEEAFIALMKGLES